MSRKLTKINSHDRGDETLMSREELTVTVENVRNYQPKPQGRARTTPQRGHDVIAADRYGSYFTSQRRNVFGAGAGAGGATAAPQQMRFSREQTRRRYNTESRGIIGGRHLGDGENMASAMPSVSPVGDNGSIRSKSLNELQTTVVVVAGIKRNGDADGGRKSGQETNRSDDRRLKEDVETNGSGRRGASENYTNLHPPRTSIVNSWTSPPVGLRGEVKLTDKSRTKINKYSQDVRESSLTSTLITREISIVGGDERLRGQAEGGAAVGIPKIIHQTSDDTHVPIEVYILLIILL